MSRAIVYMPFWLRIWRRLECMVRGHQWTAWMNTMPTESTFRWRFCWRCAREERTP